MSRPNLRPSTHEGRTEVESHRSSEASGKLGPGVRREHVLPLSSRGKPLLFQPVLLSPTQTTSSHTTGVVQSLVPILGGSGRVPALGSDGVPSYTGSGVVPSGIRVRSGSRTRTSLNPRPRSLYLVSASFNRTVTWVLPSGPN